MEFLVWMVFGLVVGLLAEFVVPGNDSRRTVLTIVLGIVGAAVGGWLGPMTGLYREGDMVSFIMAAVGAVVLLGLSVPFMPKRRRS